MCLTRLYRLCWTLFDNTRPELCEHKGSCVFLWLDDILHCHVICLSVFCCICIIVLLALLCWLFIPRVFIRHFFLSDFKMNLKKERELFITKGFIFGRFGSTPLKSYLVVVSGKSPKSAKGFLYGNCFLSRHL